MSLDGVSNNFSVINAGANAGENLAENGSFMVKAGADSAQNLMQNGIFGANVLTNGMFATKLGAESIMKGIMPSADKQDVTEALLVAKKNAIMPNAIVSGKTLADKLKEIIDKLKGNSPEAEGIPETTKECYQNAKPGMILAHCPSDSDIICDL